MVPPSATKNTRKGHQVPPKCHQLFKGNIVKQNNKICLKKPRHGSELRKRFGDCRRGAVPQTEGLLNLQRSRDGPNKKCTSEAAPESVP